MKEEQDIPFIDKKEILSAELRRLSKSRNDNKSISKSRRFKKAEKEKIYNKTSGVCHICGIKLSPDSFSITASTTTNGETFLPACKACKRMHDNYLPEEIKWILKIGLWVKTQIEYETEIGNMVSGELTEIAKYGEYKRKNPRNPIELDTSKYPIKENHIVKKKKAEFKTIGEVLYWSYANLGMAIRAVNDNAEKYGPLHYIIRKKLFTGFMGATMNIASLFGDEKSKLNADKCCVYCGSVKSLQIDHIIPRNKGGKDAGENLVWACRKCNASKNDTDLLEWYEKKNEFPPLKILRTYMKLVIQYCVENELMNVEAETSCELDLPFSIGHIPLDFPNPDKLIKRHVIEKQ